MYNWPTGIFNDMKVFQNWKIAASFASYSAFIWSPAEIESKQDLEAVNNFELYEAAVRGCWIVLM